MDVTQAFVELDSADDVLRGLAVFTDYFVVFNEFACKLKDSSLKDKLNELLTVMMVCVNSQDKSFDKATQALHDFKQSLAVSLSFTPEDAALEDFFKQLYSSLQKRYGFNYLTIYGQVERLVDPKGKLEFGLLRSLLQKARMQKSVRSLSESERQLLLKLRQ